MAFPKLSSSQHLNFFFVVLIVLLFTSPQSVAQTVDLPSLFSRGSGPRAPMDFGRPQMERSDVQVDFSLLRPAARARSRILAILPDKNITIVRKRTKNRGVDNYSWFGKIEGSKLSSVVFTVVDGVMFGHIDSDGVGYYIEPSDGAYRIVKHDRSRIPLFENDALQTSPDSYQESPIADYDLLENGTRIDVMVLYTQQMFDRYGGAGMAALIQNFIDLTNVAYSESGINTQIHLAHASLYTQSGASEDVAILDALNFFTDDTDVADLRDTHKADLVNLLRRYNNGSACGVAWVMQYVGPSFSGNAYSIVEVRPLAEANPYYCHESTFAHELGHNLGCAHDRDHASVNGAYSYSFGYDVPGVFGTIMSYDGPTITRFSTPDRSHNGYPIGISTSSTNSAHNVLTINNTRTTAANFMVALPPDEPDITVSSITVNFGGLPSATASDPHTINISNRGVQDLIIDDLSIIGPDASEFSISNDHCSGQTLIFEDGCSVDLIFTPQSPGEKTATLGIPSNDFDTPFYETALAGEGLPPLELSPMEGTIGTNLDITGFGFGFNKPKVYVKYLRSARLRNKNLKVLTFSDLSISALWHRKLGPGTYPLYVHPKGRGMVPIYIGEFTIMAPMIDSVQPLNGSIDSLVTISGRYFTVKKPKIYLKNDTMRKMKKCRVLSWEMDPLSGESTATFRVPKLLPGEYVLTLKTAIASTVDTFIID